MSMKYEYVGEGEIMLAGYGIVKAGDIIEVKEAINHPHFKLITEKKEAKKDK